MTNASDRARGNTVHLNGKSIENAGAFAPDAFSDPEVDLTFTAPAPIVDESSYKAVVSRAADAAGSYYDTDVELMSDIENDTLLDDIASFELSNPEVRVSHQLHTAVAGGTSEGGDVAHEIPMLSLCR